MSDYSKPTYIIIQEAMAEQIRFLEDELYNRAYPEIERQEVELERKDAELERVKQICINQQEILMDYEWDRMKRATRRKRQNRRRHAR